MVTTIIYIAMKIISIYLCKAEYIGTDLFS